jgi:eukaryotic-like serine/threonine-protein kinase
MGVFSGEATMLYCPKCRQTYEDGSQRFCSNEGARLLPALLSVQDDEGSRGVFSSLLTRKNQNETPAQKISNRTKNAPVQKSRPNVFTPPPNARFLKREEEIGSPAEEKKAASMLEIEADEISLELETDDKPEARKTNEIKPLPVINPVSPLKKEPPSEIRQNTAAENQIKIVADGATLKKVEAEVSEETVPAETKPIFRLVKSNEIPSGTAEIGDRRRNPLGRGAVSSAKPRILLGQVIKGRYKIVALLGEDQKSLVYLAEDLPSENKKVVLRVLMQANDDDLTYKLLAEERVTLSHIKHPNVAALVDSGELPEGKPFIVTEYFAGESVAQKLSKSGSFDARRAARIVRQASYALSEVHQNGILHRALRPENLIMTVNGGGAEQIKVTDFAISDGWKTTKKIAYIAPEQLEEKPAIFAGDIYSLGVIAFQMLTNRLPFDAADEDALRRQQKQGLKLKASDLRLDLPTAVDEVLEKALAYNPAERYPKARDFGDAFFNALAAPTDAGGAKTTNEKIEASEAAKSVKAPEKIEKNNAAENLPWENRSPEPPQVGDKSWMLFSILGLAILLGGLWAIWHYFLNRPTPAPAVEQNLSGQTVEAIQPTVITKPPADIEAAPPERKNILQPPNTNYFQNTRENLTGELARNYRGFSFFYPSDWEVTPSAKNFADVAKRDERGLPIEQMLVTFYESKGTFREDLSKFPALVQESNKRFAEQNETYRFIGEGASEINGGWKVYEMKFEAEIPTETGAPLKLYGRRIFMPAMQPGVKTGFVITMLATSLAPEVKSADDVGAKGDLKTILETFEPMRAF